MAEDLRPDDPDHLKRRLIEECRTEEENCLYTSTTFFIWLKFLRSARALLWVGGVAASAFAASHILRGAEEHKLLVAGAALLAVVLPGTIRTLRLDKAIDDYAAAAATFKILQGEFRRAANVWSQKHADDFEADARKLFKQGNDARKPSLTPPDICFWLAQKKIKSGDYDRNSTPGPGSQ